MALIIPKHGQFKQHALNINCSIAPKTLFIVPTDAHYYKIIEILKQFEDYNTCSDMFRFTQETSSGSSPIFS
jgi:hypothetical protein